MNSIINKLEITNSLIILDKNSKEKIEKSARNIPNVDVITVKEINPVNLIKSHKVAVTSEALKQIEEWINV